MNRTTPTKSSPPKLSKPENALATPVSVHANESCLQPSRPPKPPIPHHFYITLLPSDSLLTAPKNLTTSQLFSSGPARKACTPTSYTPSGWPSLPPPRAPLSRPHSSNNQIAHTPTPFAKTSQQLPPFTPIGCSPHSPDQPSDALEPSSPILPPPSLL